jgi:3-hydroxybutyryl-CoA dehydrogenase
MTEIGPVGVTGAGTMGAGIALACALARLPVVLYDSGPQALAAAEARLRNDVSKMAARGHLSADEQAAVLERIVPTDAIGDLAPCDLVIEAVFEDAEIKAATFRDIERVVRPHALLATNTSTLSVASLAGGLAVPDRLVGMHFFIPAHVNRLVEIVAPETAAQQAVDRAKRYCALLGKEALVCRDTPGFVVNRFYLPLINDAARAIGEGGCSPDEGDAAARAAFRLAVGPLAVCNMGRPKTTLAAIEGLRDLGPFYAPAEPVVAHAAADTAWPLARDTSAISAPAEMVARLQGAVFFAVLDALDGGVTTAANVDRAAGIALRFGRAPAALMDELGRAAVERLVAPHCERHGMPRPSTLPQVGHLVNPSSPVH